MEGPAYLHFNITNMITIWIMALAMGALSGFVATAWKNRSGGSGA